MSETLSAQLAEIVPVDRELVFVCVGTDRSTGDAYGPLVGTALKKLGLTVYGTLNHPVHAINLRQAREEIAEKHEGAYVIAVDACLGKHENVMRVTAWNEPLTPGTGVGKQLGEIGDCCITGVVNVSGFMEYHVLQNTRLSIVMQMVDGTVQGISSFLSLRQARCTRARVIAKHPSLAEIPEHEWFDVFDRVGKPVSTSEREYIRKNYGRLKTVDIALALGRYPYLIGIYARRMGVHYADSMDGVEL